MQRSDCILWQLCFLNYINLSPYCFYIFYLCGLCGFLSFFYRIYDISYIYTNIFYYIILLYYITVYFILLYYLSARFIFYGAFILNFKPKNFLQATLYARTNQYQSSVLYIIFSNLTSSLVLDDSFGTQHDFLFAKYSPEKNNILNSQFVWFTLN